MKIDLGDLISIFYDEFLALYGDEEIAASAAAAIIIGLIADNPEESVEAIA